MLASLFSVARTNHFPKVGWKTDLVTKGTQNGFCLYLLRENDSRLFSLAISACKILFLKQNFKISHYSDGRSTHNVPPNYKKFCLRSKIVNMSSENKCFNVFVLII